MSDFPTAVVSAPEVVQADQLRPLDGRVLIQRALRAEKTVGGIILPETTRQVSQTGVVVSVADDVMLVTVGDRVIFSQYAAAPVVATQETDLVLVRDKDLLAIVQS